MPVWSLSLFGNVRGGCLVLWQSLSSVMLHRVMLYIRRWCCLGGEDQRGPLTCQLYHEPLSETRGEKIMSKKEMKAWPSACEVDFATASPPCHPIGTDSGCLPACLSVKKECKGNCKSLYHPDFCISGEASQREKSHTTSSHLKRVHLR